MSEVEPDHIQAADPWGSVGLNPSIEIIAVRCLNPDIAFEPQRTQSTQRNPRYFQHSTVKLREWIWKILNSRVSRIL